MLSKQEIDNKNLLENADFAKGESKSVTDFLEIECDKCENQIKFRLGIGNIKDVEDYIDKLESDKQKLIEKLEKKIRYFEEYDELIATSNDNYSDGTVIKRFIDEFREILSILKGENYE